MTLEGDSRFAAALEECCRRVRNGERLERCLEGYPLEYQGELARLVPLATGLSRLGMDPSVEFQARLGQRLMGALDMQRRSQRVGLLGAVSRFFTALPLARTAVIALVVMVVLVGSGVGVIQASDGSLPDSPLYHVKTARDWLELALARNGDAKVGVYARQIYQQGRELQLAVRLNKPRPVVEVLALRLATTSERIVDQALALQAQGNKQPAVRALALVRAMYRGSDRLIAEASPEVRPPLQRLRTVLEQQERRLLDRSATGS